MNYSTRSGFDHLQRHVRFVTAFDAEMIDGDERGQVVIGDISAGGALVRASDLPMVGTEVWLRAAGLNAPARVMWVRDGLCGVRFKERVDPLAVVRDNTPETRK